MTVLISGVLLWAIVHLMPAVAPGFRQRLVDKLGEKPYRGVFALLILGALVLIVRGWQSTPEQVLYILPQWSSAVGIVLMVLSFILIGAAHYQTAIRRVIRHPMLSGVIVWSVSHLITNGTTRAWVMFGGIGIWAILEILLINRREGAYTKPVAPGFRGELVGVFISGALFLLVLYLHPYFTGVSPLP